MFNVNSGLKHGMIFGANLTKIGGEKRKRKRECVLYVQVGDGLHRELDYKFNLH